MPGRFGWIPDLPDHRDHMFAAAPAVLTALPTAVDLRPQCPKEVYDQGQLGSCTGNAIAGAIEFDEIKQKAADIFTPSRLFIYYNERVIEGTVNSDSGAQIRDGIKTVSKQGACHETIWPYDITKFRAKPSKAAYTDGAKHTAVQYQRLIQTLTEMKGCLAAGYPFVFGFTVYESFESATVAKTGVVPYPATGEKVLGGHAVLAVGYDDASQRFIVRNSWGPGWGMKGYFTIPYSYLTSNNLADDFWTIRLVG
jgi:C1A family cysteine protease